jgi:hypothetical protein
MPDQIEGNRPDIGPDTASVAAPPVETPAPAKPRKKHKARIEHKVRGRIRMKVPAAKFNPEILEVYREAFSAIPGITSVTAKPETGSIVIHYDPNRETEFQRNFQRHFDQHLDPVAPERPGDEIAQIASKIEAEAEFLAAHSRVARTTVDFCKSLDRELKLATGNTIDLKIVIALGLAAYTFFEIGGDAATPMWVTLALFSLNHFAELHGGLAAAPGPAVVRA